MLFRSGSTICSSCPSSQPCKGSDMKNCDPGKYNSNGLCKECPPGSQCFSGKKSDCPTGYYSETGKATCTVCPAGKSCSDPTSTPVECNAGSYAGPGSIECTICPAGSFCPDKTTPVEILCPIGTYQDQKGQTSCISCEGASGCNNPGKSTKPTYCAQGQYFDGLNCIVNFILII